MPGAQERITSEHVARTRQLLEYPRSYYERVEDHLSFVKTGGLRWDRRIQVRLPDGPGDEPSFQVLPLGMFLRRRMADISVTDCRGRALPFLTRADHGRVLSSALLQKYPVRKFESEKVARAAIDAGLQPKVEQDPSQGNWEPQTLNDALTALAYLVFQVFTAERPHRGGSGKGAAGDAVDQLVYRAAMQLNNCYKLSGRYLNDSEENVAQDLAELTDDLSALKRVTQYLCWIKASPGEAVTINVSYTTADPALIAGLVDRAVRVGSGWTHRFGQFRSTAYAQAGLAGTQYALSLPVADHAASYYFTIEPPSESKVDYLWWGSGHSLEPARGFMCSSAGFNLHNGDLPHSPFGVQGGAVNGVGGGVQFFVRQQIFEHKQLAAGGILGCLLAVLFAVGALDASLSAQGGSFSWFAGWLALTPLAFIAFSARNRRGYYGLKTVVLRCSIWVYLSVCVVSLIAVSSVIGANAPSWMSNIFDDHLVYSLWAGASVFIVVWYGSVGRSIALRVGRFVGMVELGHVGLGLRGRDLYALSLRHHVDVILLFGILSAVLSVVAVYCLSLGEVSAFGADRSRWTVLGVWICAQTLLVAFCYLLGKVGLIARESYARKRSLAVVGTNPPLGTSPDQSAQ